MYENEGLARELARMIRQFKKYKMQHENPERLRQSEFFLLAAINRSMETDPNGVKTSDLSTQMEITPAAVTHLINSLEAGGFIERFSHAHDRRIVLVKLTEKGKYDCIAREMKFIERFQELVDHLGEEDSIELIRILGKAYTFLKEKH